MTARNYMAILLEELRDQMAVVLEYVGEIPAVKKDVAQLKQDVSELRSDMQVVKVVVTDHSRALASHEIRVTDVENLRA